MFKIFHKKELKETKNTDVHFKLEESKSGDIVLKACDEDGVTLDFGYIISITEEGYLYRHIGVNENIGLHLNKMTGTIKEEEG